MLATLYLFFDDTLGFPSSFVLVDIDHHYCISIPSWQWIWKNDHCNPFAKPLHGFEAVTFEEMRCAPAANEDAVFL